MEQDPDQAGRHDHGASVGGASSLDLNFSDDDKVGAETLAGTIEPVEDETSTLEPPPVFMDITHDLPESSSPGNTKFFLKKLLTESPCRKRKKGAARLPFLGTLPENELEVHHRDHENRTGCGMDRVAFMEEVWTLEQCYGIQSMMKTGLNQLEECEGRMSYFLIDSATNESEVNSPIKVMQQKSNEEVVYLSRTRKL